MGREFIHLHNSLVYNLCATEKSDWLKWSYNLAASAVTAAAKWKQQLQNKKIYNIQFICTFCISNLLEAPSSYTNK